MDVLCIWVGKNLLIFSGFVTKIIMKKLIRNFSEYMQKISRSKIFCKFVLIVNKSILDAYSIYL